MKSKHTIRKIFIVTGIISGLLFGSVSALAVEKVDAGVMRLSKVEGTVAVLDSTNKPKKATNDMKLSSGNNIATNTGGFAWINLDSNKLVKLDALSKVKVTKDEKNLVVDVSVGKIFVDVSKNFEKNESLIIRTSNVVTTIKGKKASAEIDVENGDTTIVGLAGKIDCVVTDVSTGEQKQVEILSGKKVEIQPNTSEISIVTKSVTKDDISGFSKLQIAQDPVLKNRIVQASGSKIGKISESEAKNALLQDMDRQVKVIADMAAKKGGMDPQGLINAMMGADISPKNLGQSATPTPKPSTSGTFQPSSDGSASDSVHAHVYGASNSIPATCTKEGSRSYFCNICGDVKTETIPKVAHNYEEISYIAPTCTMEGSRVLRCSVCGNSITESISIIEHSYNGDALEPTILTEGEIYNCQEIYVVDHKYCTICNSFVEQPIRSKFTEHSFDGGTVVSEANCTENQRIKFQCTNMINPDSGLLCTALYEEIVSGSMLGHQFEDNRDYVGTSAICYRIVCNRCGEYSGGSPHTFGDTSDLPTTDNGDQYIRCAESSCSMSAKYSWNSESEQYEFTGSWE